MQKKKKIEEPTIAKSNEMCVALSLKLGIAKPNRAI